MELSDVFRFIIFYELFSGFLFLLTKFHYWFSDTHLKWKYFKEDYSYIGAIYFVVSEIGKYMIMALAVWQVGSFLYSFSYKIIP